MSLHSDTLFRVNESWFLFLIAVCLAEKQKQQIPFVLIGRGLGSMMIFRTLTITPLMQLFSFLFVKL